MFGKKYGKFPLGDYFGVDLCNWNPPLGGQGADQFQALRPSTSVSAGNLRRLCTGSERGSIPFETATAGWHNPLKRWVLGRNGTRRYHQIDRRGATREAAPVIALSLVLANSSNIAVRLDGIGSAFLAPILFITAGARLDC